MILPLSGYIPKPAHALVTLRFAPESLDRVRSQLLSIDARPRDQTNPAALMIH
jgi:hypothetical protein